MTTHQIQQILLEKTGHITIVSKNTGRLKDYTRFKIKGKKYGDLKCFDKSVRAFFKETFPDVGETPGLFIDLQNIDVLNLHIEEEVPVLFEKQLYIF
jgi:hypothetical protein